MSLLLQVTLQPAGQRREHFAAQRLRFIEDLVVAVLEPDLFAQLRRRVVEEAAAAGRVHHAVGATDQHQRGGLQQRGIGLGLRHAADKALQYAGGDGGLHQRV
ncbi:hypothetical protein D3C72_2273430 [compost metagenome]